MMRSIPFFLALICLSIFSCNPQEVIKPDPPAGSFVFGGEGREAGFGMLEMSDGNVLTVGTARLEEFEDYDLQLLLVSPTGELIWTRTYRKAQFHEAGHRIVRTSTGYVIIGYQNQLDGQQARGWFWQMDDNFDIVREQAVSISGGYTYTSSFINALFQLPNGGFLVGQSVVTENYVLQFDADFQLVESTRFPVEYWDSNVEFLTKTDNGFMAASATGDYSSSSTLNISISHFDENGDPQWATANSLGLQNYTGNINAFAALQNGDLVALVSFGTGSNFLVRFDSLGNFTDQVVVNATGMLGRIRELPSGNLLLGGNTAANFYYEYDQQNDNNFTLAEIDSSGSVLWQENFGGRENEQAHDLLLHSNGSALMIGSTQTYGLGEADNFLVIYKR